jgi:hypothetical protein
MRYRRGIDLLAGSTLMVLAGCGTPTHLIFYQSSVLGIDVSTSVDNSTVHAKIGYDRQTGTIVPKTMVKAHAGSADEAEAMSVVSRSRITVDWFAPSEICERFATGQAALNVAARAGSMAALRRSGSSTTAVCEGF